MSRTLEGINEKIKRSNETIRKLHVDTKAFFDRSDYPSIPHEDDETFKKVIDYHRQRPIPVRFGVLAGEVVHHLRSCLDHIVWGLSCKEKRQRDPVGIAFPILDMKPANKKELEAYNRKVEGLLPMAKITVDRFQPYQRADFANDPLSIIHHMDIFDKHRELTVVFPSVFIVPGRATLRAFMEHRKARTEASFRNFKSTLKSDSQSVPRVAFGRFGDRESYPLIPGLQELSDSVSIVVGEFEGFFIE